MTRVRVELLSNGSGADSLLAEPIQAGFQRTAVDLGFDLAAAELANFRAAAPAVTVNIVAALQG